MHPQNKRERFERGKRKGQKRAKHLTSIWSDKEFEECQAQRLKDTSKRCSCEMCRNPRHNKIGTGKDRLTIQERKVIQAR